MQVYLCEKLSLMNEMYFAITLDRKISMQAYTSFGGGDVNYIGLVIKNLL